MVFSPAQVKFGYAKSRDAADVLPAVRVPDRLLGRVPEEPAPAHAGRRARAELPVPGTEAVLCAHPARLAATRARRASEEPRISGSLRWIRPPTS